MAKVVLPNLLPVTNTLNRAWSSATLRCGVDNFIYV